MKTFMITTKIINKHGIAVTVVRIACADSEQRVIDEITKKYGGIVTKIEEI